MISVPISGVSRRKELTSISRVEKLSTSATRYPVLMHLVLCTFEVEHYELIFLLDYRVPRTFKMFNLALCPQFAEQ